ncbi:type I restriction endonuclease [Anabaena subtropica]|uniref:Restriction endonuclease subunit R n=1 Tax=Anabaena subtropica FACHB-260 TaxID=2692884 RepID=A0ABR8CIP9_9NOST|nr:type I restriction endonuclease [Anabaena subtropica]MBD2343102.1 restriction endonuclease subunit R [Anabaena subtropica FACHB-260]
MVQFIQAQNIGLAYLEERFGLQPAKDESFFTEWLENLPEITDLEKQYLDRAKFQFLRLVNHPPIAEETVKLVILSPLLDLAGFYDEPFFIRSKQSIEIAAEDKGEIVRGRIDVLVIQQRLWLLAIESKRSSWSLLEGIPQALAYMIANPDQNKPIFGLVTNGSDFIFIKLTKDDVLKYDLSDQFTLFKRENELYKVLGILKNFSQILS